MYNLYLHTQLVLYLKIHNSFQMLMYCLHSPVSLVFFLQPAKRNKKVMIMYLNIYNSTTMTGMGDSLIDVNDWTIINEESNAQ